jgi:hypothetical protein
MKTSQPIESVAKVAATPAQAKVFVALLQAEGIPARVEGDSLVDEFAASRRLMNLIGTRVMVPTASLDRAQEILQPVEVDAAELERQALAATSAESSAAPRAANTNASGVPAKPTSLMGPLLVLSLGAAGLFAFLWQRALSAPAPPHPEFDYTFEGNTMRETLRKNGRLLRVIHDAEQDLVLERQDIFGPDGKLKVTCDHYEDGNYLRVTQHRTDGFTATWTDEDRDGVSDRAVVADGDGKVVQTIEWQPGLGFVIKAP